MAFLAGLVTVLVVGGLFVVLLVFVARSKRRVAMQMTPYTSINASDPSHVEVTVLVVHGRRAQWRPLGHYPSAQAGLVAAASYWGHLHRRSNLFRLWTGHNFEVRAFGKAGVDY